MTEQREQGALLMNFGLFINTKTNEKLNSMPVGFSCQVCRSDLGKNNVVTVLSNSNDPVPFCTPYSCEQSSLMKGVSLALIKLTQL